MLSFDEFKKYLDKEKIKYKKFASNTILFVEEYNPKVEKNIFLIFSSDRISVEAWFTVGMIEPPLSFYKFVNTKNNDRYIRHFLRKSWNGVYDMEYVYDIANTNSGDDIYKHVEEMMDIMKEDIDFIFHNNF